VPGEYGGASSRGNGSGEKLFQKVNVLYWGILYRDGIEGKEGNRVG